MPKQQKKALTVQNITHPKSRKAIKIFKQSKKHEAREKSKMVTYMKQNLLGEKMVWFKEHLPPDVPVCSKECAADLIQTYLSRYDEELEQIRLKHSIGQRKNRQHASREDVIRHTQDREKEEYNTCGIELPNLLDPLQMKMLREWSGELRFIQNFTLCRLGKKHLLPTNSAFPVVNGDSTSISKVQADTEPKTSVKLTGKDTHSVSHKSMPTSNLKSTEIVYESDMEMDL